MLHETKVFGVIQDIDTEISEATEGIRKKDGPGAYT